MSFYLVSEKNPYLVRNFFGSRGNDIKFTKKIQPVTQRPYLERLKTGLYRMLRFFIITGNL